MKFPGWMIVESRGKGRFRVRLRRWHPGLWLCVYRHLRSADNGVLTSLWFTGVFVYFC